MTTIIFKIQNSELTESNLTSKLSTYVYSVANYKLIDIIRKNKKELARAGDMEQALTIQLEGETEMIDYEAVLLVLQKLNPPCYELLLDFYIHKLEYNFLAQKYGYSNYNSVKKKKGKCIESARQLAGENFEALLGTAI